MTTRAATSADVPAIVAMGERFIDTEYPGAIRFDGPSIATMTQQLLDGAGVVFVAERDGTIVGMMALTTYKHPMSGETIATEIVWWMDPSARGGRAALQMLRDGETWARARGAARLQMIAPSDHVGRFYERLGFERVEVHYQRRL